MTPHLSPHILLTFMTPSIQVSYSNSDSESDNMEVTTRQHKKGIITDSDSDDSDNGSTQEKIQEKEVRS